MARRKEEEGGARRGDKVWAKIFGVLSRVRCSERVSVTRRRQRPKIASPPTASKLPAIHGFHVRALYSTRTRGGAQRARARAAKLREVETHEIRSPVSEICVFRSQKE